MGGRKKNTRSIKPGVYIIGEAIIGENYAIFAEDFSIRNSLVAVTDVQKEANVQAYSLEAGQ